MEGAGLLCEHDCEPEGADLLPGRRNETKKGFQLVPAAPAPATAERPAPAKQRAAEEGGAGGGGREASGDDTVSEGPGEAAAGAGAKRARAGAGGAAAAAGAPAVGPVKLEPYEVPPQGVTPADLPPLDTRTEAAARRSAVPAAVQRFLDLRKEVCVCEGGGGWGRLFCMVCVSRSRWRYRV